MRFKDFLKETEGAAVLRPFANNIRLMQRTRKYLFRGVDNSFEEPILKVLNAEVLFQDQLTKKRVSRSDNNLKMFLASAWNGFPDRALSTFTSFSFNQESQFGDVTYLCIPADSVNLYGYTPMDFNDSGDKNVEYITIVLSRAEGILQRLESVSGVNETIDAIVKKHNFKLSASNNLSSVPLESCIKVVDDILENRLKIIDELENISSHNNNPITVKSFPKVLKALKEELDEKNYSTFTDACASFTPESMDAKSYSSFANINSNDDDDEVWFVGDALLVRATEYEDIEDAHDFNDIIDEMAKMVK